MQHVEENSEFSVIQSGNIVAKAGGNVAVGAPESAFFKKFALDRILFALSLNEVEGLFTRARLQGIGSVLTGVDTFLGTSRYVVVTVGSK